MCPVCLATMGLYVAGGVSAGGITSYLATRLLRSEWKRESAAAQDVDRTRDGRERTMRDTRRKEEQR